MSPSQRFRNLDIQDALVSFVLQLIGRVAAVRGFLKRRYRCTMQPSSKETEKKNGDALYYVMTQA